MAIDFTKNDDLKKQNCKLNEVILTDSAISFT